MRQFYVNRDSVGFMKTAYSTYEGSQLLTDYWGKTTNRTVSNSITQGNKNKPRKLEDTVSSTQVTTP